jgi:uroporphyrinogen-III synthase
MPPLHGVGVLVTRPEQQAMPLCRLLETQGATTFRLPAIAIKPLAGQRALAAQLGDLENFGLIIFVSANAVRFGATLLEQKRDLNVAAVGPATARALNQAGYRVGILPGEGFDSESLLALPHLKNLTGSRVLLIKGSNGRELLEQELTRRGAEVTVAEVYQRERTHPSAADLAALHSSFSAGAVHVITATSLEIAVNLLELAPPDLRAEFDRVHWLVPSARVADGVREHGIQAPLLLAASAEDQDLLAALIRWRSSASGA